MLDSWCWICMTRMDGHWTLNNVNQGISRKYFHLAIQISGVQIVFRMRIFCDKVRASQEQWRPVIADDKQRSSCAASAFTCHVCFCQSIPPVPILAYTCLVCRLVSSDPAADNLSLHCKGGCSSIVTRRVEVVAPKSTHC